MSRLMGWWRQVEDRAHHAARKVFPGHWSFLLGEIALVAFAMLVATGLYLAFSYEASAEPVVYRGSYVPLQGVEVPAAFLSVMDITFEQPLGRVIRQTHHWSAIVFIGALVLHAARVFFTGAFRRPRRLNWAIGLTLAGLASATGFFGLGLPHDLLGGTSARIGHSFAVSIPVIGAGIAEILFGGLFGNPDMLHRFWQLHVIILPIIIGTLLAGHLALVWVQTHTQFPGGDRTEDNVHGAAAIPGYALKTTGIAAVVAGVLLAAGAVVQVAPIWIHGPFDATAATVPAQPDWYLAWVEGALRIFPAINVRLFGYEIPSPFFTGLAFPLAIFAVLYVWPFAEAWLIGDHRPHHLLDRPRDRPVRTAFGAGILTLLTVLMAAAGNDLQAAVLQVPIEVMTVAYRVLLVAVPPVTALITYSVCRTLTRDERHLAPGSAPEEEPVGVDR